MAVELVTSLNPTGPGSFDAAIQALNAIGGATVHEMKLQVAGDCLPLVPFTQITAKIHCYVDTGVINDFDFKIKSGSMVGAHLLDCATSGFFQIDSSVLDNQSASNNMYFFRRRNTSHFKLDNCRVLNNDNNAVAAAVTSGSYASIFEAYNSEFTDVYSTNADKQAFRSDDLSVGSAAQIKLVDCTGLRCGGIDATNCSVYVEGGEYDADTITTNRWVRMDSGTQRLQDTLTVKGVTVKGHKGSDGGAFFLGKIGDVLIEDNLFEGNDVTGRASIIYTNNTTGGTFVVRRNKITLNTSVGDGSVFYLDFDGTNPPVVDVRKNLIYQNTGTGAGSDGTIYINDQPGMTINIAQNYILSNTVEGIGGAIYTRHNSATLNIVHNVVQDNLGKSANNGAALYFHNAPAHLAGNILVDNYHTSKTGGNEQDIYRNGAITLTGNNNLIHNPDGAFTDGVDDNKIGSGYDPGLGTLQINNGGQWESKLLDKLKDAYNAGDNADVTTYSLDTDYNGNGRIKFLVVDMGPLEVQPSAQPPQLVYF